MWDNTKKKKKTKETNKSKQEKKKKQKKKEDYTYTNYIEKGKYNQIGGTLGPASRHLHGLTVFAKAFGPFVFFVLIICFLCASGVRLCPPPARRHPHK